MCDDLKIVVNKYYFDFTCVNMSRLPHSNRVQYALLIDLGLVKDRFIPFKLVQKERRKRELNSVRQVSKTFTLSMPPNSEL